MATMELQHLKEIAAKLGMEHSPNIGAETLKNKIKDFCTTTGIALDDEVLEGLFSENSEASNEEEITKPSEMTNEPSQPTLANKVKENTNPDVEKLASLTFAGIAKAQAEAAKHSVYKRAMKLVRCVINCNNPNKRDYTGDIFFARNKDIPGVKKMVPFGVPTHVPQILLNVIKEKQLQQFVTKRLPNGLQTKTTRLVPEYNVKELKPLTTEEFNAIRQRQLAEGAE